MTVKEFVKGATPGTLICVEHQSGTTFGLYDAQNWLYQEKEEKNPSVIEAMACEVQSYYAETYGSRNNRPGITLVIN